MCVYGGRGGEAFKGCAAVWTPKESGRRFPRFKKTALVLVCSENKVELSGTMVSLMVVKRSLCLGLHNLHLSIISKD